MKKLLLSITLLGSLLGNAQILTETFQGTDFPPTGWTTATNVATRPWGFTTVVFNATGQATFNITDGKSAAIGWIAQAQDAHLTSPTFSLVGYSDAAFSFKAKVGFEYMVAPFANGDLTAEVSINGGTTWVQLWVEEDQGTFADYETLDVAIDMTPYIGEAAVQVRFHYVGNDADSISVDDVSITGTLGVNQILSSSFSTFPNPVNDVITLTNAESTTVDSISISDINGRTVKSIAVNNLSEIQINVADLTAGVYLMNINSNAGKAVKKFIKN
jgi:hypothetical protein